MKFRKDINGLRALAVISVVLFHFNSAWMPGGFAGVDVFFVISGFLMTSIIFRGIENKNFSILDFYVARGNRIIPALALLCIVLAIVGWFILSPSEYKALGKHIASSVGFLSNIVYWREAGYFDAASHTKWLLHTWSLSVEWQFYIIYPILLVMLHKVFSINTLKRLVLVSTVLGFIGSAIISYKSPNAAYYLFPTRAWEMMFGGLAFLYPLHKLAQNKRKYLEWAGLILIVSSYFLISADNLWPGYLAFFPVLGTYLVIQAQSESRLTGNYIFQKLGAWSYSIYLWHWPFVVAIYTYSLPELYIYVGMALSVLCGYLSYNYIEKIKFPRSFPTLPSYLKHKPAYIAALVAVIGLVIFIKNESLSDYRFTNQQIAFFDSIKRGNYECFDKPYQHSLDNNLCTITSGNKKVLALGDSHSYSLLPAIEEASKQNKVELTYTGYSGCPPLVNTLVKRNDQEEKNCKSLNDKVFKELSNDKYNYLILTARWTYYTEGDYNGEDIQNLYNEENSVITKENSIASFKKGVDDTFSLLAKSNTKVYVMLQVPLQTSDPDYIYMSALTVNNTDPSKIESSSISLKKHNDFQKATNEILISAANRYDNIHVLDPASIMCGDKNCAVGSADTSYYFDDDHLSIKGSLRFIDMISRNVFGS